MKILLLFAFTLLFHEYAVSPAIAQPAPPVGLACIAEMSVPTYRGVVWLSRTAGQATISIDIGSNGFPISVDVQSAQPLLVRYLKVSMQTVRFIDRCAGQTIKMTFVYRLIGDPGPEPRNEVTLKPQNTFEISARPPISHSEP